MNLSLIQAKELLEIESHWGMEDLIKSFRSKARVFHPDMQRSLEHLEKAHEMMILLNDARQRLENYWKEKGSFQELFKLGAQAAVQVFRTEELDEIVQKIKERFLFYRERAKKGLYIYFRFNLSRIPLRESGSGLRWYREYRRYLDKALLDFKGLLGDLYGLKKSDESGALADYYLSFMRGFIFFDAFQRAAECSTILDDYSLDREERRIFQLYRNGSLLIDEALNILFLKKIEGERVNLGMVKDKLTEASSIYSYILRVHPKSDWIRESNVKGQLVLASLNYLYEFY
jgi:hypothetical protein